MLYSLLQSHFPMQIMRPWYYIFSGFHRCSSPTLLLTHPVTLNWQSNMLSFFQHTLYFNLHFPFGPLRTKSLQLSCRRE